MNGVYPIFETFQGVRHEKAQDALRTLMIALGEPCTCYSHPGTCKRCPMAEKARALASSIGIVLEIKS